MKTTWQAIMMLASMVFSCQHMTWSNPSDHVELFAGDCSISKGEWKDGMRVYNLLGVASSTTVTN